MPRQVGAANPGMASSSALPQSGLLVEERLRFLAERVGKLEKEVLFLRRCCRTLFSNDGGITSYLFYADFRIYGKDRPVTGHPGGRSGPSTLMPDVPDGQLIGEVNQFVTY